ncbi:MAG: hypothetical protein JSW06_00455 [Thermoplasmatales archaeon]|nr:MAG: hypothetical protein JSW06_00455 [Thermoplasmatales archaeon]
MKSKIVGILVCMMLLTTFLTVATNDDKGELIKISHTELNKSSFDDDVPIWENEDLWEYDIDTCQIQVNMSGQFMGLDLSMDNFILKVEGTTATSYQMSVSGRIKGTLKYDDGAGTTINGSLFFTSIFGSLLMRQTDLAVEETIITIRGIALLTEHPLPLSFPIPFPATITVKTVHTTPRPILDFPLFDGKSGILPETFMSVNIKLESIVLKILHIFIADIPEEIILDTEMDVPVLQYSATAEEVTVKAGIYDAYNIVFFEGLFGSIYYAPVAGNVVKVEANMDVPDQLMVAFNGELKNTNYLP